MECRSVKTHLDCMAILMHYQIADGAHALAADAGVIPLAAYMAPLVRGTAPLARGETYAARGVKPLGRERTPAAGGVRDGTRGALALVREMAHPGRGAAPGTRGMTPPAFFRTGLGALFVLVFFQALDDLGDFDFGFADLAAAELQEPGGAAELFRETVDVDLFALDPFEDAFELVHRRPEARGLRLKGVLHGLAHDSSTRLLMLPPESCVTTVSPAATWPGCRTTAPAAVRVML